MGDFEGRRLRSAASARRELRSSSASRDYREASSSRDQRESSVLSSITKTTRSVRASSVLPASLKHYDDLAEADEEYIAGTGYCNRGLHQAKRALSEAREILRQSVPRESSVSRFQSSSSSYEKSSRLAEVQEHSADLLRERRENRGLYETGTYKITVVPEVDTWSPRIPRRLYTRSTVAALLAAYSPRNFPDFIFGRYGGSTLHRPVSSTADYYDASTLKANSLDSSSASRKYNSYEADYLDSSAQSKYSRSGYDRSAVNDLESSARLTRKSTDEEQFGTTRSPRRSSYESLSELNGRYDLNNLKSSSRYSYDYNGITEGDIISDKKKSKFYHYWIPRHYPGTPMRGGYLVNAGHDYGWRY